MERLNRLLKNIFCLLIIFFYKTANCKETSSFMLDHVKNSYDWHLFSTKKKHVAIHLPIIVYVKNKGFLVFSSKNLEHSFIGNNCFKGFFIDDNGSLRNKDSDLGFIDFSISKNIFFMMIGTLFMIVVFLVSSFKMKSNRFKAPAGFFNLLEMLIIFVRDDIVKSNIGNKKYKTYLPYALTMFFFIWINNLLGLLPGAANVTGNFSVTMVLAFLTFLVTTFSAKKNYWAHIFKTPGVPFWLLPIMIPIEIIGMFTKPISLMIRLFANITAGHIILLSIIGIIFILKSVYVSGVSVPFGAFMLLLKLLVAFLQAYIFTLLTCIYIGTAVGEEKH